MNNNNPETSVLVQVRGYVEVVNAARTLETRALLSVFTYWDFTVENTFYLFPCLLFYF